MWHLQERSLRAIPRYKEGKETGPKTPHLILIPEGRAMGQAPEGSWGPEHLPPAGSLARPGQPRFCLATPVASDLFKLSQQIPGTLRPAGRRRVHTRWGGRKGSGRSHPEGRLLQAWLVWLSG